MYHKNKLLKSLRDKFGRNKRKIIFILLLLLISILPASLLFKSGFPVTDDGTWLIIRFSAFIETLKTGQIPVRFIYRLNDGMGYPVSNFLYPLYLYLATPIYVLGLGLVNSMKILFILNIFLSSTFTFFWLNKKFNDLSSFIGSIVLILSPYFLFDIYSRGSVGEILTFSIVPFILWQIERKSFVLTAIGISFLILAHNTLGFLFLLLIFTYVFLNKFDFKSFFKSFVLGIGLSAFFWLPAIYDLSSTIFLDTKVSSFYDYFFKSKDFYLIGISSVVIIILSILQIFYKKKLLKNNFFIFSIAMSIVIIILQMPQSKILWEIFPFRDFIQFPFRLLSLLTILLCFQAALTIDNLNKSKYFYAGVLILLLTFQSYFYLNKVEIQKYDEGFYSTNQSSTTVSNEYLNKWFKKPESTSGKTQIISGKGKIVSETVTPGKISVTVELDNQGEIQINNAYFPSWEAVLDGTKREIEFKKNGLIILPIEEGKHSVEINYKQSLIHKISNIISVISIAIIIFLFVKMLNAKPLRYNLK